MKHNLKKILILGAGGNLGKDFLDYLRIYQQKEYNIIGLTHEQLDITLRWKLFKKICDIKPDIIINCSALTNIDYCEDNPEEAYAVNVYGAKIVAEAAQKYKAKLIHISTNHVIEPVNEYSWSKLLGEQAVLEQKGLVIRTTYYNNNYWIIKDLRAGKKIKVLNNIYYNPISSFTLMEKILHIIDKNITTGIMNIGTEKRITPYEFALEACDILFVDRKNVKKVNSIKQKVKRPKNVYLELRKMIFYGIAVDNIHIDLNMWYWLSTDINCIKERTND